ncbi:ecdysone oxidase-like [Galleria mellonella]|uniref:Ecdysone oxidase-like n=1 Tax=Galleria mellonella TaxID=7137 RepID=A0ABM3N7J1_GALME|nr:ecdysone oxidase-like [Galleria mellonella]XP_052759549.1 ecdysone oxidase-like [Galleria mellonella]
MDAVAAISNIHSIQNALQVIATLQLTSYMFPHSSNINDGSIYDYIVVGAGSAGSVVANRLTEDPNTTVLLVEAGGDPPVDSVLPGLMVYLKETSVDWNYTSSEENSRICAQNYVRDMTRGKMLGGCSSMNYMLYARGDPHDYNTWADILKDESWNYDNVLPYFIKSENLLDPDILNSPNRIFHGVNSFLNVTKQPSNETHKYLAAFKELGYEIVLDSNGNYTLGYSQPLYTIANNVRQSTAHSFLGTIKNRPNLYILKNSFATKIIFDDNNNAIGLKIIKENDEIITVKANKEIIISTGTINTPQLLMLSGIGPREHLLSMGIDVISDLPVGENLQDHAPVVLLYAMENKSIVQKSTDPHRFPTPLMTGYVALNKSQVFPDYQTMNLITDSASALQFCAYSFNIDYNICQRFYEDSKGKEVLFVLCSNLKPKSRGRVLLQSTNPKKPPLINLGHYSDYTDIEKSIAYANDFNRILKTKYFKNVDAKLLVTQDCQGLEQGSEEFWRCYIPCISTTIFHYVGTCAMGSVLDSRLRVSGVQKLRVVDGSAIPIITSGNTNVPIIMIAEKAADMIKEDNAKL